MLNNSSNINPKDIPMIYLNKLRVRTYTLVKINFFYEKAKTITKLHLLKFQI